MLVRDPKHRGYDRRFWGALGLWVVAASAFTWLRIPYDDEWFSIELALSTEVGKFWLALQNDVHPPWLALLDRGLGQLLPSRFLLHAIRIACTAFALVLLAPVLERFWAMPRWGTCVVAFHPILFMYGGALRWYPVLLLAHALRAHTVWREDALRLRSGLTFVSGSLLGSLAGYLDPLFVAHDLLWLAVRGRQQNSGSGRWQGGWQAKWLAVAVASVAAIALVHMASPLSGRGGHGVELQTLYLTGLAHWDWAHTVVWAGLGLTGEAALPLPLALSGLLVPVAAAWGLWRLCREPVSRGLVLWVGSYGLCWFLASRLGVWHPRYSLGLWLLALSALVPLFRSSGGVRWLAGAATAHLALAFVLTVGGRGFFKADLNEIGQAECTAVEEVRGADLVVVPYARLHALIERHCGPLRGALRVPSVRMSRSETEQLAELDRHLPSAREVWMLHVNARSSLSITRERIRRHLAARCRRKGRRLFGEVPHLQLKRMLIARAPAHRFGKERWRCQ